MKKLTVSLADLEGTPHGSNAAHTAVEVTARYTGAIALTDGKIIPAVLTGKPLPTSGAVSFDVYASDDPEVAPEYHGFAIVVTATLRPTRGNSGPKSYTRTVKVLESSPTTVALGTLEPAEGVPAQWTSVADFVDGVMDQVDGATQDATDALTAAQAASSAATTAATDAADAVTLAQQAQAAALEVPDANVSALVGNPATQTAAALNGHYAQGEVDTSPMTGTSGATWDRNEVRVGHPDLTLVTGPAADSLIVGGGHKGTDYTSPNEINSTDALYRLMTIIGGYDSTITDALASTMLAPMHAHIHAGSTHAAILGGSYQNLYNVDYGGAILGTGNTVGLAGVPKSGWHVISLGGRDNNVSSDGGTTGGYATVINGIANTIRSTTTGDASVNGGLYAAIVGGIQNTNQGNASGQLAGQANRIGDDVDTAGSTGSHSGQVGGYTNKVTTGRYAGQVGGYGLIASGDRTGMVGGTTNTAAGLGAGTVAGQSNTVTGQYSAAVGGSNHDFQSGAQFAGSVGGSAHTLTHRFTGALGGRDSTISGENAVALGGRRHILNGMDSSAQGVGARTRLHGIAAYGYGWFAAPGDAQSFVAQLRREYQGGSAAAMYLDPGLGAGVQHLVMPDNSAWRFVAEIVGKCAASNETIGATITGTIKRGTGAASTALVGTPVVVDQKDNPAWNVSAIADTAQGGLQIRGQHGDGTKNVRWSARMTVTEIVY